MAKPIGKRVSFLISPEMAERVANIKRELYFDRPCSDLYRDLILRGLASFEKGMRRSRAAEPTD